MLGVHDQRDDIHLDFDALFVNYSHDKQYIMIGGTNRKVMIRLMYMMTGAAVYTTG